MIRRYAAAPIGTLSIDRTADEPLYRQVYFAIREAILDGRLRPNTRLPSTRTLASDLSVSRNTVKTHMRSMYSKLGTHSRSETILRARALGLLAPSGVVR